MHVLHDDINLNDIKADNRQFTTGRSSQQKEYVSYHNEEVNNTSYYLLSVDKGG